LYVFYNANLVQGRINKSEGFIGFIDDYNAWATGSSVAENTRRLHTQLLPKAETWARESRAVFEAEKTASIHFMICTGPTLSFTLVDPINQSIEQSLGNQSIDVHAKCQSINHVSWIVD
jgi:hypothetical protein